MKLKFFYMWAATVTVGFIALFAAASYSSETAESTVRLEDEPGVFNDYVYTPANKPLQKVLAIDTITNTEKDTLAVPWVLASPYQYSYQFTVVKLTGFNNNNFKAVLDQANTTNSTRWMAVDSFIRSGADSTRRDWLLKSPDLWGAKHRIRIIGASVNLTRYTVEANIKPTN